MLTRLLAISALALLVLPAAASARSFERTYPRAAALCAAVDAGRTPAGLAGAVAQVKSACASLKAAHAGAEASFKAATAGLEAQMAAIGANARAACADALAARNFAACAAAMRTARAALRPLQAQWRTAARAHRSALASAGQSFWRTLRSLRGTTTPVDPPPDFEPPPGDIT
jgi:hypothetical protein